MTGTQVVILCGGMGTRLAELTEVTPKPMVPIGGRPILWHIMQHYSHFGFGDFVLCLGHKGDLIRTYFSNYLAMNSDLRVHLGRRQMEWLESFHDEREWTVTLAETGEQTPTGGRIKRVEKYLTSDTIMLTYSDAVADVDLRQLLAFHEAHGRIATVTGVRPRSRFGELNVDGDVVVEFKEKPELRETWVSGGFFVFDRRMLEYLTDDTVLESELLERLATERQLRVFRHDGFWHSMDTLRDVRALNDLWAAGKAPWKVW